MKIGLALVSSARGSVAASLLVALVACSGSSSSSTGDGTTGNPGGSGHGDAGNGGSSGGGSDSGASAGDSGSPVVVGDGGGGTTSSCDAAACASVTGFVLRTATKPTHGGKGSVYVALFDQNPITNQSTAHVVGRALIPNQDMTSDTAKVAYRIDGVPPRATAYQAIAFLDDANGVTASNPQPASGDLVSLDLSAGFGGVPVTVSGAGEVHLDLSLNMAMP